MTASWQGSLLDRRTADHHRVAEAGLQLRLGQPLRVRPQVEEAPADPPSAGRRASSTKLPWSASCSIRCAGLDREVMAALRADAEVLVELVVPVVRTAGRTRVRVRLPLVGLRHVCARSRRRSAATDRVSLEPRAAQSRVSGATFSGSGETPSSRPERPGARLAHAARGSASASASVSPPGSGMNERDLAGVQRVAVERDVDAIRAVERSVEPVLADVDAARRDELLLRRIEVARADQHDVVGVHGAGVDQRPQRRAPTGCRTASSRSCSGHRARRPRRARRRSCRAARPVTAPTCAQQQPPSTSGRAGSSAARASVCSWSESSDDDGRLRVREAGCGPLRPSPRRPRPRHAARARARPRTSRPQTWHS